MTPSLIPAIQVKLYLITAVIGFLSWILANNPNAKKLALIATMAATVINYPFALLLYLLLSAINAFYTTIVETASVRIVSYVSVYILIFVLLHKLWRRK